MSAELDWDAIYRQCAPSLRRFIRTRVPEALVEDALQDTFVRAYRSRARFDAARPPLPWLLTIARRACFETVRVLPPETPWASVGADGSRLADDPHQLFESRLRRESIVRALGDLSPRHRRLLLAWDVERDAAYPLLAEQEGISTKALKSALCRARSAFRARYAVLAERVGVAAGAALWPARLRARVQRALVSGSPWAEASVGAFAAAVVSVAVVVLVPTPGASGTAQALVVARMSEVASPVSPTPELVLARRTESSPPAGAAPAPVPAVGNKTTSQPKAAVGAAGIAASGSGELAFGPDASRRSITVGVHYEAEGFSYRDEVEVRCDTTVRQLICDLGRQAQLPDE